MYDTGQEVWELLSSLFPQLTDEHRALIFELMDPSTSREDRRLIRTILESAIGVDPKFEIHWHRSIQENPDLLENELNNRRLLFDAWYNDAPTLDERLEARDAWEGELGRDPFLDDGPMRDWES